MEKPSPLLLGVVAIEKGAFGSPSTKVTNFTFPSCRRDLEYADCILCRELRPPPKSRLTLLMRLRIHWLYPQQRGKTPPKSRLTLSMRLRIRWLYPLQKGKTLKKGCSGYVTAASDNEALILKIWGVWSTPSLVSLPVPLWAVVSVVDRVLSTDQINLFKNHSY